MNSVTSQNLSGIGRVVHGFLSKNFIGNIGEAAHCSGLERIYTIKQVHSNIVFLLNDGLTKEKSREGDAIVTSMRNLGVGIYTADCVPLLLVDGEAKVVAAVHAGWRGTLSGIVNRTVKRIERDFGILSSKISAAIGPSIGMCCFEVGEEVAVRFMNKYDGWSEFLYKKNDSKYFIDLRMANVRNLLDAGVANFEVVNICTKCNKDFHSYRREGKGVGRQLSFIGLV
jgi:YfiH family protein